MWINPGRISGAVYLTLNLGLKKRPDFVAGQPISTALSPDGKALLVLTSGYNSNDQEDGATIVDESHEYVFVYDVSRGKPTQKQVLQLRFAYTGLAWNPQGTEFYVSGGVDDSVGGAPLGDTRGRCCGHAVAGA